MRHFSCSAQHSLRASAAFFDPTADLIAFATVTFLKLSNVWRCVGKSPVRAPCCSMQRCVQHVTVCRTCGQIRVDPFPSIKSALLDCAFLRHCPSHPSLCPLLPGRVVLPRPRPVSTAALMPYSSPSQRAVPVSGLPCALGQMRRQRVHQADAPLCQLCLRWQVPASGDYQSPAFDCLSQGICGAAGSFGRQARSNHSRRVRGSICTCLLPASDLLQASFCSDLGVRATTRQLLTIRTTLRSKSEAARPP
jgi:hypothetical protein